MNDNPTPSPSSTPTTSTTSSGSKRAKSVADVTSKRRKFTNLANGRVSRAMNAIRVVANLSKQEASRNVLADADVEIICTAIEAETLMMRKRLTSAATGEQLDVEFDLDQGRD